jgi:hypothetical protein
MANSYNPIIGREKVDKFSLIRTRPTPEPGVDLVLAGSELVHVTLEKPLTAGEFRWGQFRHVYRVNVSEFLFSIVCPLPSRDHAHEFQTEVDVACAVADPKLIVQRDIKDVKTALEPLIIGTMRTVSRAYLVEQSAQAEAEIAAKVKSESETYGIGIRVHRVLIRIKPDQATLDHFRSQVALDRKSQLTKAEAAAQNAIRGVKASYYEELVNRGESSLLVQHLVDHPDDAASVLGSLRNMRREDLDAMLRALDVFLDKGGLQNDEKAKTARKFYEQVTSALNQRLEMPSLSALKKPLLTDGRTPPAPGGSSGPSEVGPAADKPDSKGAPPPQRCP